MDSARLGNILLGSKELTEAQLKSALDMQQKVGGRLGTILVKMGYISEEKLASFLSTQLKLPLLALSNLVLHPSVSALLDLELLEKYHVLPLHREGDGLVMAVVDPLDLDSLDSIHFLTGLHIKPMIASRSDILKAIDHYFHGKICPTIEAAEKKAGLLPDSHAVGVKASPQAVLQALTELLIEKKVISEGELLNKLGGKGKK